MAAVYSESWQVIRDYLFAKLQAENVPGGALESLAGIERIAPPASTAPKMLGFQFRSASQVPGGQNRFAETITFEFNIIVLRDFDPLAPDDARRAFDDAENTWNDRQGHGLGAVFRDDPSLGGNAIYFSLDHQIVVGRGVISEAETSAVVVARMTIRCESNIT